MAYMGMAGEEVKMREPPANQCQNAWHGSGGGFHWWRTSKSKQVTHTNCHKHTTQTTPQTTTRQTKKHPRSASSARAALPLRTLILRPRPVSLAHCARAIDNSGRVFYGRGHGSGWRRRWRDGRAIDNTGGRPWRGGRSRGITSPGNLYER